MAEDYNPLASRWLSVATAADAPNVICLFYSLLNTIVTYDPKSGLTGGAFAPDAIIRTALMCLIGLWPSRKSRNVQE